MSNRGDREYDERGERYQRFDEEQRQVVRLKVQKADVAGLQMHPVGVDTSLTVYLAPTTIIVLNTCMLLPMRLCDC